jgi:7-cyano-7-deazaguanine synthase
MNERALVVLSGGQDSTTCLYWAIGRFGRDNVEAVTFNYGQRHHIELKCAERIAKYAGVPQTELPIDTFAALGGNSLVDSGIDIAEGVNNDLPNTFVPGRNLVFLTFAAAFAWRCEIGNIVTGVAQADYSGYPDCRQETIDALTLSLQLGMDREFVIHTPLMNYSKKETVLLAVDLGALEAMSLTHTCYKGVQPPCEVCPACVLRAKGFSEAGIKDPLLAA